MVRRKKLSPTGAKDTDGEYHNVHVNLNEAELSVAGMDIGDEVFVRVRENKIVIQKTDMTIIQHNFRTDEFAACNRVQPRQNAAPSS